MNTIRFFVALILSKLYLFVLKILHQEKDDKPGYLAIKIYPDFLSKIKKPNLVIAVTGTNGKTTTTNLLAEILIKSGKKVIYNDWGANLPSSAIRCLLDGVTIFNTRKKIDIAILETDEILSKEFFPKVNPNYLIVTNLFRDSMHRNAHSEFVFNKINNAITKNMTLILNADDPVSSMLGENNKSVYFGIDKLKTDRKSSKEIVNDMILCPKCNTKLIYDFSRYHHIGKVHCPSCDFKSKEATYSLTNINEKEKKITINNIKYNLIDESIFNIYNELAVITLLKELNMSDKDINKYLENQKVIKSRQNSEVINGIEIKSLVCKGMNSIATSRICDYISKMDGNIEVIITIDDTFDNKCGSESIGWIYDADFEFLNKDNIKRIVVGGVRSKDYKVRLLLAGIPEDKIYITKHEINTPNYLTFKDINKIIILYDVYYISGGMKIKEGIINKIRSEKHEN